MTSLTLNIHLSSWEFIPTKGGKGWGTYLRLKFLCFTVFIAWREQIEKDMQKSLAESKTSMIKRYS